MLPKALTDTCLVVCSDRLSANSANRAKVLVTGLSAAERIYSHPQCALLVTLLFLLHPVAPNLMA